MATRRKGGGYAGEDSDQGEAQPEGENGFVNEGGPPADDGGTGENAGGSGAGSQAPEEAQQPAETPVDPHAADVLSKYPAIETIAGASVCEVTDANGVVERKVLARIIDGTVQLTHEGQWIWDTEFGPGATKT